MKTVDQFKKSIIIIFAATAGVYLGFSYLLPLFFPFILAYFITKLILPIVRWSKRTFHIPLVIGGMVTLLLFFGVMGVFLFYIGRALMEQLKQFIQDLPYYELMLRSSLNSFCNVCDRVFGLSTGCVRAAVWEQLVRVGGQMQENIMPMMTEQTLSMVTRIVTFVTVLSFIVIAIINMIMDFDEIKESYEKTNFYQTVHPVTGKLASVGIAYVKTQTIIMSINAIILTAGLFLGGNKYALLFGMVIAVLDAFPVIGSGLFLIPWALIELIRGDFKMMLILILLYATCEFIRSLLEPRLLGNRIGIKPIFTLMAMYLGVELFGIIGFLLGPLALVIIKTIVVECIRIEKNQQTAIIVNSDSKE